MEKPTHMILAVLVALTLGLSGYQFGPIAIMLVMFSALLPDIDQGLEWLRHRKQTHSLIFAILYALFMTAVFGWAIPSLPVNAKIIGMAVLMITMFYILTKPSIKGGSKKSKSSSPQGGRAAVEGGKPRKSRGGGSSSSQSLTGLLSRMKWPILLVFLSLWVLFETTGGEFLSVITSPTTMTIENIFFAAFIGCLTHDFGDLIVGKGDLGRLYFLVPFDIIYNRFVKEKKVKQEDITTNLALIKNGSVWEAVLFSFLMVIFVLSICFYGDFTSKLFISVIGPDYYYETVFIIASATGFASFFGFGPERYKN